MTIWRHFSGILFVSMIMYLLMSAGCGYRVFTHADLPFKEIGIGLIDNKTLEPKLQDKLHNALAEEFLRQGITVNNTAANKLTGVISNFDMSVLSEKGGITIQYRVLITADFRLTNEEGKIREIKKISSPFIVSFAGSEDLGMLLATRDLAEERAMQDIAVEIAGALIYK